MIDICNHRSIDPASRHIRNYIVLRIKSCIICLIVFITPLNATADNNQKLIEIARTAIFILYGADVVEINKLQGYAILDNYIRSRINVTLNIRPPKQIFMYDGANNKFELTNTKVQYESIPFWDDDDCSLQAQKTIMHQDEAGENRLVHYYNVSINFKKVTIEKIKNSYKIKITANGSSKAAIYSFPPPGYDPYFTSIEIPSGNPIIRSFELSIDPKFIKEYDSSQANIAQRQLRAIDYMSTLCSKPAF